MTNLKASALLSFALLFSTTGYSYAQDQKVTMLGTFDCGQWLKLTDTNNRHIQRRWVLGYLSGANLREWKGKKSGKAVDLLAGVSNEQIELLVDRYCQANPLKTSVDAGSHIIGEILEQK
jgi:hypothetical protein